ncbi:MAG: BamA/TamA family outer membrane protein [Ignavibacteriales bacterium]|nr:BamA/TamA family outer membrane protein [Ignavibacteriales bacterium]
MTRQIIKFTFFIISVISAQVVKEINIEGNSDFYERDYLNWINVRENSILPEKFRELLKENLNSVMNEYGYLEFSVDSISTDYSSDSQFVSIIIYITESEQTKFKDIFIESKDTLDEFILNKISYLKEKPFNTFQLQQIIKNILDESEQQGFPFSEINIKSIYFYEDTLSKNKYADVYLSFDKGQSSIINKIEITGNDKTKDYVITRNARVREGDLYTPELVDYIPARLNKLKFFEPVKTPSIYFNSKNECILKIEVTERQTNSFDGIVGYIPDTKQETGYFTGYVQVNLRNILGTERGIGFRWQQENKYSQELEIKYLEPWLMSFPININLGLFQRKQDSTYVQRKLDLGIEYIATEYLTASILLATGLTIPTERSDSVFTVYKSSLNTIGAQLKIDTRDNLYIPTKGIIFVNAYKYSFKNISGPSWAIKPTDKTKFNLQNIEVDFGFYYQLFYGNIVFLGLHGREIKAPFFEISDLYKLGGANTLRGYREKQFLGNRIFWSNLEYRYLLTETTFGFLFFDTGYFLLNEDKERGIDKKSEFKIGYGVGFNLNTPLGVLVVSYAMGQGDSFSEGKIHFGLNNEF